MVGIQLATRRQKVQLFDTQDELQRKYLLLQDRNVGRNHLSYHISKQFHPLEDNETSFVNVQ